jgi:Zn-dependent peptidase ImmA (M78 family)
VNNIFKEYINTINKLTLVFYDKYNAKDSRRRNAYAFVSPDSDNTKIHINCSLNDKTPYETLIHEIQHILYNIKPLNPEKQVGDVFVNSNTKKMTFQDFFDILKNPTLKIFGSW